MKKEKKITLGQKLWMVFQGIAFICVTVWATRETESLFWGILGGVVGELCLMALLMLFIAAKPDENDVKKVKSHMLYIMQFGHREGLIGTLVEFNKIFHEYSKWRLQDWEVFRAWYKHNIDDMLLHPEIYQLKMKSGGKYSTENDPLYDPDAQDWTLFDRDHSHDNISDDISFEGHRKSMTETEIAICGAVGYYMAHHSGNS